MPQTKNGGAWQSAWASARRARAERLASRLTARRRAVEFQRQVLEQHAQGLQKAEEMVRSFGNDPGGGDKHPESGGRGSAGGKDDEF